MLFLSLHSLVNSLFLFSLSLCLHPSPTQSTATALRKAAVVGTSPCSKSSTSSGSTQTCALSGMTRHTVCRRCVAGVSLVCRRCIAGVCRRCVAGVSQVCRWCVALVSLVYVAGVSLVCVASVCR